MNDLSRCCICCYFRNVNEDYICQECYGWHRPRPQSEGPWPPWEEDPSLRRPDPEEINFTEEPARKLDL